MVGSFPAAARVPPAATPPRRRATEKRDDVAPFQLIELHSGPLPARAELQDI
jgi:hypothetical protein